MNFDPTVQMDASADLYSHPNKMTATPIRSQYLHIFRHSASASFLAYLPIFFWCQVLHEINTRALREPFTLRELMQFLGILFYMTIVDNSNYWGQQVEDVILGGPSVALDSTMSLRRFKEIRQAFSIKSQAPEESTQRDPTVRIRTLLNLLKVTGGKYIELGRNVALDETSVACRSRYGRSMIVYNPRKPAGKYHFKLYMLCCSSTWIAVNYRLHCASELEDRLEEVADPSET